MNKNTLYKNLFQIKVKGAVQEMFLAFENGDLKLAESIAEDLTVNFDIYFADMEGTFSNFSSKIGIVNPNLEISKKLMRDGKSALIAERSDDVHAVMKKIDCNCSFSAMVKSKGNHKNPISVNYGLDESKCLEIISSRFSDSVSWASLEVYSIFEEFLDSNMNNQTE